LITDGRDAIRSAITTLDFTHHRAVARPAT
jgi:hypothetical protein